MAQSRQVLSGQVWTPTGFVPGQVWIRDGKITAVDVNTGRAGVTAERAFDGAYITPGLIDLQINGAVGYDFTRQPDSVANVAEALPRWGVTGFLPTFITAPLDVYQEAFRVVKESSGPGSALVLGLHFEGPYLNPAYRGAHDPDLIREPSLAEVRQLLQAQSDSPTSLRMVTLAPEQPGALDVIRELVGRGVLVAVGHSGATYEETGRAFEAGAGCVTHLFNAIPALHHRRPGPVGAALEADQIVVNLIVDGVHLHPAVVGLIYRLKGWQGITLVTDAIGGMGMPAGQYDLAGQSVIVDETSARLADAPDTLAGSILTLNRALRNMVEFTGCPPHEAVAMATLGPARLLGLDRQNPSGPAKGRLAPGYDADIAVFSPDFEPLLTLVGGQVAFEG